LQEHVAERYSSLRLPGADTINPRRNYSKTTHSSSTAHITSYLSCVLQQRQYHNFFAIINGPIHRDKQNLRKILALVSLSSSRLSRIHPVTLSIRSRPFWSAQTPQNYTVCIPCSPGISQSREFSPSCLWHGPTVHISDVQTFAHTSQHILLSCHILGRSNFRSGAAALSNLITTGMASRPDFNSAVTVPTTIASSRSFWSKERWLELIEARDIDALQALLLQHGRWPLCIDMSLHISIQTQGKIAEKLCIQFVACWALVIVSCNCCDILYES